VRVPTALLVECAVAATALACDPIVPSSPPAPANACPAHPCEAYVQAGSLRCSEGRCVVDSAQPGLESGAPATGTADLLLLVTPSPDALFGAGSTFALRYDALHEAAFAPDAGSSGSAALPPLVQVSAAYVVSPQLAQDVIGWNLGNGGNQTSLPMHATFEHTSIPLPDGSVGLGGLPLDPVTVASDTTNQLQQFFPPAPGHALGQLATAWLPPGTYRETWVVDPPFSQAFGPVIQSITVPSDPGVGQAVEFYETTKTPDPTARTELPTFTMTRDGGSFDGWSAYMRDLSTGTPGDIISNVVPLSGTSQSGVQFALRRVPPGTSLSQPPPDPTDRDADAILGTVVVAAPPAATKAPTCLFFPVGTFLQATLAYPTLPALVTVSGSVGALSALTDPVDLVFEALGITTPLGLEFRSLQYTAWATATPDPGTGVATYSVDLPPGEYRVDAHPRSAATASGIADLVVPAQGGPFGAPPMTLGQPQPSTGLVSIRDGRPLQGATIVATPLGCPPIARAAASSSFCLPRGAQSTSGADGSFVLALDPGTYRVRVQPPLGSRLPWVSVAAPLVVEPGADVGAPPLGPILVPAPIAVGLRLVDPDGNALPNAWVRGFRLPGASGGAPIQVGEALTDADGRYELYVTPPE
jgi:hypothetical protein